MPAKAYVGAVDSTRGQGRGRGGRGREGGKESKRAGVGLLDGSISPQWAAFDALGITELQTVQGKTLNSPVMIGKRRTCDQIMQNHS